MVRRISTSDTVTERPKTATELFPLMSPTWIPPVTDMDYVLEVKSVIYVYSRNLRHFWTKQFQGFIERNYVLGSSPRFSGCIGTASKNTEVMQAGHWLL